VREGCRPARPLGSTDNHSPSSNNVLRYRTVGLSASAESWDRFDGSEVHGGMAKFSPTRCPTSTRGFVGDGVAQNHAASHFLDAEVVQVRPASCLLSLLANRTPTMIQITLTLSSANVVEHALVLKIESIESIHVEAKQQQRTCRRNSGDCSSMPRRGVRYKCSGDWPIYGSRRLKNGWTPRMLSFDVRFGGLERAARRSRRGRGLFSSDEKSDRRILANRRGLIDRRYSQAQ
jgi:hypothetical protein